MIHKNENWLPIEGYEGYYEISDFGRVRSLDRVIINKNGVKRPLKGMILSQAVDKDGYMKISLAKDGKEKEGKVHQLVANAFIPIPEHLLGKDDLQINHKDENPANNHVDNLEWCDVKYNINYGNRTKKVAEKLSQPVMQIDKETGEIVKEWPSAMEAVRKGGFSSGHISQCCNGKRPYHLGFIWKKKNG